MNRESPILPIVDAFGSVRLPLHPAGIRLVRLVCSAVVSCATVITVIGCTRADAIDTIVRDRMAQERIPGAAIAVLKAGQIVKVSAYGLTGTDRPVPTKPDSIFRIQSATKPDRKSTRLNSSHLGI